MQVETLDLEPETLAPAPLPATSVSIIIPAFNEEQGLPRVLAALDEWKQRGAEIIVVDDGSTDNTRTIAEQAGVTVIRHRTNKGYGASLKSGVRAARGEIVVTMDSDGQFNPADIERLLHELRDSDMAVGMRGGSYAPNLRKPGKWVLGQVANYLAETRIPDLNSGFRAIRVSTVKRFLHVLPNGFSFTTTLTLALFKEGYNVAYVPVVASPRAGGRSTVKPLRDGFNTILLIVRTIALFDPLKVFVPASGVLALIGIVYWLLDSLYVHRPNIPSGAVILLVSAVVVFMFGILADQVSAIRREKNE